MKKANQLMLVGVVLTLSVMSLAFVRAKDEEDRLHLKVDVTALNNSGVSGTATVDIGEDGLRGKLKADGLAPGHGYTVWFFYLEGSSQAGPGRFDSNVAEDDDLIFRGHVGGLRVSSGATVKLLVFDHPDLTALPPTCSARPATNVARANNLLTPACGSPAAQAVFTIP